MDQNITCCACVRAGVAAIATPRVVYNVMYVNLAELRLKYSANALD